MQWQKTLRSLSVILALSLSGCVSLPAKDDSRESDLEALTREARSIATPRTLPNGKTYCVEDARTEGERDACALMLEDAFYLSEEDKASLLRLVEKAVRRLSLARKPCGFWATITKQKRCTP